MNSKITQTVLGLMLSLFFIPTQAQKIRMSPELLWELGRVSGESLSPDGSYLYFGITNYNTVENKGNRDLFMIPVTGGEATQITSMPGSEYGLQFVPNTKKIGFMNSGHWWEADYNGENAVQITTILGEISDLKYSPDGKKVAYTTNVKIDHNVTDLYPHLPMAEAKIITDLMYRHWDHWEDGNRSHVFIADYDNGKILNPIDIMKDEPFDCPQQPFGGSEDYTWSMDGKILAYVSKKLTGVEAAQSTNSDIYLYNIDTKETKNITKNKLGYDQSPSFSPDGKSIAWLSMATPGYESDQQFIINRNLTTGKETLYGKVWDNTISAFSWSNDGKKFIIRAGVDATYQIFETKVSKKESEISQITTGQHNVGGVIGETKTHFIASKTDMNHAAEIYSFDKSSGLEKKITMVNDLIYSSIEMGKVEKRWMQTTDGKKMLTWVIYPPNFDENRKYPALLYCQGGPQSAVSQFYSFRWNFQLMAAEDYIIIAPNRRGLPTFGVDWNHEISKDWGGQPMDDYLSAVEEMKKEPFIDETKIGAIGASYGGYSVYMLAGIHNNTFCSFISHCGLYNLESWYGVTEELFFANYDIGGAYWENQKPKSYDSFSPHKFVGNWNTPIMVIHGGNDFRVPINQGMEAFQAAKIKGLKTKFLYYPNEGHWVLKPQNGLLWHSEFFKWLDETVKNKE